MKKLLLSLAIIISTINLSYAEGDKSQVIDSDHDGILDACDLDSDNDGIPDAWENSNSNSSFKDDDLDGDPQYIQVLGDGISNYLDLDSDNDGILDLFESGISSILLDQIDTNKDGIIDSHLAFGNNGIANILETFPDSGILIYTIADLDGDGVPNYLDLTSNGIDFDLYVAGYEQYDDLGGGFISYSNDYDRDGITAKVDTDLVNRGAPNSVSSPYAPTSMTPSTNSPLVVNCTSLPVKLKSFGARRIGGDVIVKWATTSESNNSHFEIEISKDAKSFYKIRTVESKSDNGNSNTEIAYEEVFSEAEVLVSGFGLLLFGVMGRRRRRYMSIAFALLFSGAFYACHDNTIKTSPNETIYVRLVQVDFDGSKSYSSIVQVPPSIGSFK